MSALGKLVIIITGTPCVGKTSVARLLASRLNAVYLNLTEFATKNNLIIGADERRGGSLIINEGRLRKAVNRLIDEVGEQSVVIDGHYAASVVPKKLVTCAFVLRRDPVELRSFMEKAGFSRNKLWENLASEILDVCLVDALNAYGKERVCEINATGKSVEDVVEDILAILNSSKNCRIGVVDWLGKLESEGLLNEYLRV
ncbi:MAG: adenylate kinase family protein [Candidatus Bathyarchaeia archaeon]